MRNGEVVETGRTTEVIAAPKHEYTRMLLAAVKKLEGEVVEKEPVLADAAH
jgi:ABC-type glutathione transport system ATPase component